MDQCPQNTAVDCMARGSGYPRQPQLVRFAPLLKGQLPPQEYDPRGCSQNLLDDDSVASGDYDMYKSVGDII
jgi:hypothetical protein